MEARSVKGKRTLREPLQEADIEPMTPQEVADWLGIPLEEFPLWAVAYLERVLANTGELARAFRNKDDEKSVALVKQLDARCAQLRRLIRHWSSKAVVN